MQTVELESNKAWEIAKPHYVDIDGNRIYATAEDGRRWLGAYFKASQELREDATAQDTFKNVMHALREIGVNCLQPAPAAERKLPEPWIDPVTKQPLPDPYEMPDGPSRRKSILTLGKYDPELLEHYKRHHEDPYGYVQELQA
jgi:hypothetical protein